MDECFTSQGCISGGIGGTVGAFTCHPIDTVKCRIQSQGSANIPVRYRNGFSCFADIIKTEKVWGLYKGVLPPIVTQCVINTVVFGVQEYASKVLRTMIQDGPWKEVIVASSSGMAAGFAQTVVCAPMELVKLRTQHQAIGEPTRYQGNLATLKDVWRRGGIRGCFRGFWITACRDTPAFGVYFATYESLMQFTAKSKGITRDDLGPSFHFFYGGFAGVASWLSNYPIDVVKTRFQLDGANGAVCQYRSSVDSFKALMKEGGVKGLYRGLAPSLLRAFANSAFIFITVEAVKKLYK